MTIGYDYSFRSSYHTGVKIDGDVNCLGGVFNVSKAPIKSYND